MFEEYTQKDFKKNAKNYNVNIGKGFRTLHKKNGCHCSTPLWEFIPFDSLEEVESFEKIHEVMIWFGIHIGQILTAEE